jgi:hypothetical protein
VVYSRKIKYNRLITYLKRILVKRKDPTDPPVAQQAYIFGRKRHCKVGKLSARRKLDGVVASLTLFTLGTNEKLFTLGEGHMAPLPKIPGKCPLGLKLGRVPREGLNITFKPKKSQPSTYGCHKGIMKIAPKIAFCRDFAELL